MRIKGVEDLRTVAQAEALREFSFWRILCAGTAGSLQMPYASMPGKAGKDLVINKRRNVPGVYHGWD